MCVLYVRYILSFLYNLHIIMIRQYSPMQESDANQIPPLAELCYSADACLLDTS